MYTMVLMMAAGSAGESPDFFRRGGSCTGAVVAAPVACPTYVAPAGCTGYAAPAGCSGRSGFLGIRDRLAARRASAGCSGYVAPVYVAPSYCPPVVSGCTGYVAPVSTSYCGPVSSYCAPVTTGYSSGCGLPCDSGCGSPMGGCSSGCGYAVPSFGGCSSGCSTGYAAPMMMSGCSTSYAAPMMMSGMMMGGMMGCEPGMGSVVMPGTPIVSPPATMPEIKKGEPMKEEKKKNEL